MMPRSSGSVHGNHAGDEHEQDARNAALAEPADRERSEVHDEQQRDALQPGPAPTPDHASGTSMPARRSHRRATIHVARANRSLSPDRAVELEQRNAAQA